MQTRQLSILIKFNFKKKSARIFFNKKKPDVLMPIKRLNKIKINEYTGKSYL